MIDYHEYKRGMLRAQEALEQAAAILNRKELSFDERQKLSGDLTRKAAQFRREAMTYAQEDIKESEIP